MRLEINYREKNVENTNTWRLNNTLLSKQEIPEEIKEEIKKYLETNDNENTMIQNPMECSKRSSKREVYSYTSLPQETRKISNTQSNITPKGTREGRTNKTQS